MHGVSRKQVNVETTDVLLLFLGPNFFYRGLNFIVILFIQSGHFFRNFRCFKLLDFKGELLIVIINFL